MKILHTSDWYLSRSLYGRKRYDEFNAFLAWLSESIQQEQVDVLLVAGDLFDTSTPSNCVQKRYYQLATSQCRHVIGSIDETPEDEVLLLTAQEGNTERMICAVPHLHDRARRVDYFNKCRHFLWAKSSTTHEVINEPGCLPLPI